MLVFFGDLEIAEYQKENKKIINRQRKLDQVAGQKLLRLKGPKLIENKYVKAQRERDPNEAPDDGFFPARRVRAAVDDTDIDKQGRQNDREKCYPDPIRVLNCIHKIAAISQLNDSFYYLYNSAKTVGIDGRKVVQFVAVHIKDTKNLIMAPKYRQNDLRF